MYDDVFADRVIRAAETASFPLYGLAADVRCKRYLGGAASSAGGLVDRVTLIHDFDDAAGRRIVVLTETERADPVRRATDWLHTEDRARRSRPGPVDLETTAQALSAVEWSPLTVLLDGELSAFRAAFRQPFWIATREMNNGTSVSLYVTHLDPSEVRLATVVDVAPYVEGTRRAA